MKAEFGRVRNARKPLGFGSRSFGLLALVATLALGSGGCAARSARAYQRERLADRIMSFKAEAKEEARKIKALESREGSTGGLGGAGGGCACN